MNDEDLIAFGKQITKLTDIYLQKKPDLIELDYQDTIIRGS